jgi:hypothetical protein
VAPRERRWDPRVCKKKIADPRREQSAAKKITGHWGEDAVGFRWTEQDSVDDRLSQMDVGQFYSATIATPQEMTLKGIAVRIGERSDAAILFDTELLRVVCGWSGKFLEFNPARHGIIGPPKIGGTTAFHSPRQPGWSRDGKFDDPRSKPFGPLPRDWAKYRGLHVHGNRVVFEYTVGPNQVVVLESPWIETLGEEKVISRELEIAASDSDLELLVASSGTPIKLICEPNVATLNQHDGRPITVNVAKHDQPVSLKLLLPSSVKSASSVFQQAPEETRMPRVTRKDTEENSLRRFVKPGPPRWTQPITTRGAVSDKQDALVVDTLTLPFDNPYKALMFVSGHDFFEFGVPPSGGLAASISKPPPVGIPRPDAAICTLHGDVWLVSGIDETLQTLTWKRFATGLFQPLGLKIVNNQIYVVGRDQITRLHDLNGDGEADWYENFNNDGQVSANGHEYVTCLETDRDGWFYFLKGNCDGQHDHDGCLLRVSPDGGMLEVVATGFRNANGMSIGPVQVDGRELLTVAPQEGEWTPGSAIFEVVRGGFHGYTPSAHRDKTPTAFVQPLCWIPRLQDNSCGGQVWVPANHWGPLAGQMLHLSYGTSRMFLVPRETVRVEKSLPVVQGATVSLPLAFESGVMRGRFHPRDGHLYVSGLRGWVSNAAKDGCFQRVRAIHEDRLDVPIAFEPHRNGLLIRFSNQLDEEAAEDIDNYRVQHWNYRWSAAYGSPELKVSNPREEGRDEVEVLSATHIRNLNGGDAVFLELAELRPVHQLSIQMTLKNLIGQPIERRLDATIHAVRPESFEFERQPPKHPSGALTVDEQQRLTPGIRCQFVGQAGGQLHVRRMAAWRFESAELRDVREIIATGYIVAPRRGRYRLSAESSSAVEVWIGDQVAWRSTDGKPGDIELTRGHNRVKVVQQISAGQHSSLRLLWSGADFETEPIPPDFLFCEPLPAEVQAVQLGRELFARYLCFRCHRVSDNLLASRSAMPELRAEAPDLIGVGSRLTEWWLYQWMLNPQALRHSARMPRLFSLKPTDEEQQQAADVVEYLSSLKLPPAPRPPVTLAPPILARDLALGNALWEDLGCIGCHRREHDGNARPTDARFSLIFAFDKFQPGELTRYLLEPHRHFAWTRMPDFALSENEARSLAQVLIESAKQTDQQLESRVRRPKGDAARGQKLFASLGCRQCHRISPAEPLPQPHLPSIFGQSMARGCVAGRDQACAVPIPDFPFDPTERSALLALSRDDERTLAGDTPDALSRRLMAELRCAVCHPRDGRPNLLGEILSEESERGLLPEIVPNLTWAGEKLHSAWMQSLYAGQVAERVRPWMKLRMPSFPARAKQLADGLAREHGLSSESPPRSATQQELAEIGEQLATRAGLLDCRQCHPVGSLPPTGDKNTLLAPGINFALTRERLRHDYYRRFTLDPPRYDVTTRMPKLTVDGRTTRFKEIFDGDARRQFEAIWHFLQTVPSTTADP